MHSGRRDKAVGKVKIPYYVVSEYGIGHWKPGPDARKEGFKHEACGPDGPAAWAKAKTLNDRWHEVKNGTAQTKRKRPDKADWRLKWEIEDDAISYPAGSMGRAFQEYRRLTPYRRDKSRGTRAEWGRIWQHLKIYGNANPRTLTVAILSDWRDELEAKTSIDLAWRGIKIFRVLWLAIAGLKYCKAKEDPSASIRNRAPKGRSQTWTYGEVVRLVKQSWRMGYPAVACIIAIAWDSQLSVGDVRTLRVDQKTDNGKDIWFAGNRGKNEEPFVATVGPMTGRLIRSNLALRDTPPEAGILFLTPQWSAPYRKNSLAEHFRQIRKKLFGPNEKRQLRDMRRSGTFEARAGGAQWSDRRKDGEQHCRVQTPAASLFAAAVGTGQASRQG